MKIDQSGLSKPGSLSDGFLRRAWYGYVNIESRKNERSRALVVSRYLQGFQHKKPLWCFALAHDTRNQIMSLHEPIKNAKQLYSMDPASSGDTVPEETRSVSLCDKSNQKVWVIRLITHQELLIGISRSIVNTSSSPLIHDQHIIRKTSNSFLTAPTTAFLCLAPLIDTILLTRIASSLLSLICHITPLHSKGDQEPRSSVSTEREDWWAAFRLDEIDC